MTARRIFSGLAAACLLILVLTALTVRLNAHLHELGNEQDATLWGMIDFRDVIYFPTRAVLDGVNPYDSEPTDDPSRYRGRYPVGNVFPVYSPLLLLLAAPLQWLPYRAAMLVYGLFNLVLLLVVAGFVLRMTKVKAGIAAMLLLAALMLCSRPGQSNFYYGQLALPMVLCATTAVHYSERRPMIAAIALAFSTIKPTFAAPLLILLFSHRRWKAAIWGALIGGLIAALGFFYIFSTCRAARPPLQTFLENISHTESDPGFDARKTGLRLDAVAVAERLADSSYASTVKVATPLAILGIAAVVLWQLARYRSSGEVHWAASPLIMLTTLLCVFHAAYDGLLLTSSIVGLAVGNQIPRKSLSERAMQWILVCLLLVPAVNLFSSRQFLRAIDVRLGGLFYTGDDGRLWAVASILNGLCLLIAWLILVMAALGHVRTMRRATLAPQSPPS